MASNKVECLYQIGGNRKTKERWGREKTARGGRQEKAGRGTKDKRIAREKGLSRVLLKTYSIQVNIFKDLSLMIYCPILNRKSYFPSSPNIVLTNRRMYQYNKIISGWMHLT